MNTYTLEQFVTCMNTSTEYESEHLAANYAIEAAQEAGYGLSMENIQAHLDILVEAGSIFDYPMVCELVEHINRSNNNE